MSSHSTQMFYPNIESFPVWVKDGKKGLYQLIKAYLRELESGGYDGGDFVSFFLIYSLNLVKIWFSFSVGLKVSGPLAKRKGD